MANELISIRNNRNEVFGFADQVVFCGNFDIPDLYVSCYVYSSGVGGLKKKPMVDYSNPYRVITFEQKGSPNKSVTINNVSNIKNGVKYKITRIPNQDAYRYVSYVNVKEIGGLSSYIGTQYICYVKLAEVLEYLRARTSYTDQEIEELLFNPTNMFKSQFIEFEPLHQEIFQIIKNFTNIPFLKEWTMFLLNNSNNGEIANFVLPKAMYADLDDPNNVYAFMFTIKEHEVIQTICNGLKFKSISINGSNQSSYTIDSIDNLTDYLDRFNSQLIDKASRRFSSRFNPELEEFNDKEKDFFDYVEYYSKMKLYNAQKNVIAAVNRSLDHNRSAFIVGEMGAGKTVLSISAVYCNSKNLHTTSIVMAPGHLVNKWQREIERFFPDSKAVIISDFNDLMAIEKEIDNALRNYPLFLVISKDSAKINYQSRPAVKWDSRRSAFVCPHCGSTMVTKNRQYYRKIDKTVDYTLADRPRYDRIPIYYAVNLFASMEKNNYICETHFPNGKAMFHPYKEKSPESAEFVRGNYLYTCGSELWTATNSREAFDSRWIKHPGFGWMHLDMMEDFRRWYNTSGDNSFKELPMVKKYYNAMVDIDENGIPNMTAPRRYSIAKYIRERYKGKIDYFIADEVHLYSSSSSMQANAFGDFVRCAKKTIALTGTLLNGYADGIYYILYRMYSRTFRSKGYEYDSVLDFIKNYGVQKEVHTYEANLEDGREGGYKVSKRVCPGVSPELFTDFLLDKAVFISLSDMSNALPSYTETPIAVSMDEATADSYRSIAENLRNVFRNPDVAPKDIAFIAAQKMAMYPDMPYNMSPIYDKKGNHVMDLPDAIENPEDFVSNKDIRTLEIVKEKIDRGENVLIYVNYINKTDVLDRLSLMFKTAGIKSCVLTAKTKAADREKWIDEKVKAGYRVLICNPSLVETGLDLLAFTNIIFYQTGYNLFTMRQAARRSYRLNQPNPVNVYFLYYENTTQELILSLMANKLSAAMAIEGKFTEEGLNAMCNNDDLLTQIADSLVKNIEHKVEEGAFVSGVGRPEEDDDKSRFTLVNILNSLIVEDPYKFLKRAKKADKFNLCALCA